MHLDPAWVAVIVAVATAAGTFAVWLARLLWHTLQRTIHFLDAWFGQPGRDGLAASPGVLARIAALEQVVTEIRAETKPNGGASMRDAISRTAADVADVKDQVAAQGVQLEQIRAQGKGK